MPLLKDLGPAQWVPESEVAKWRSYREAVVWCWLNQRHYVGMNETARRTLFANHAGMHAPHASRCFKPDSKSPMDLPQRCIRSFETFTGWRGVRQWQLKDAELTAMEQVIEQRRAAA
ncbi:MAG TPA: hypothetical protein VEA35_13500 [Ramlibacter sp.]|nr:hypothetical protein [Candidatus Limnocylindrales bacterium]HYF43441.1 hypothetical protein [Ramlibacter sp.]